MEGGARQDNRKSEPRLDHATNDYVSPDQVPGAGMREARPAAFADDTAAPEASPT